MSFVSGLASGAKIESLQSALGVQLLIKVEPNPILTKIKVLPINNKLSNKKLKELIDACDLEYYVSIEDRDYFTEIVATLVYDVCQLCLMKYQHKNGLSGSVLFSLMKEYDSYPHIYSRIDQVTGMFKTLEHKYPIGDITLKKLT